MINYDMPNGIEDYVHRIGRSGRAGDKGHSISFMTQKNAKMAHQVRGRATLVTRSPFGTNWYTNW